MLTAVVMPQLGLEVTEGVVVEILVAVGARVEKDDPLVVLSTDKADTDVVAPVAGVVREVGVDVGETVAVGATLLRLGDDAAEPTGSAAAAPRPAEPPASTEPPRAAAAPRSAEPPPSAEPPRAAAASRSAERPRERRVAVDARSASMDGQTSPRLRAAPVARRAAADLGIALESLAPGSGPNGRITLRDVRRAAGEGAGGQDAAPAAEPLSPLKRAVARRMAASQREIPQFQLVREVDATHLLAQKDAAAAAAAAGGGARPGVNDLLVQAIGEMVVRHPDLGAVFVAGDGDAPPALQRPDSIDVGLAVATDRGLLVPVIRRATERTLREIAAERVRLVAAAREGRIDLAELSGGTISLSNLGSFGIDRFTAMVNPGESAIVAVGRTVERLVPRGRGIAVVPILTVTLSLDHRVVDGATGAGALAELAALLEGEMPWRV